MSDATITVTNLGDQGVRHGVRCHLPAPGGARRLRQGDSSVRGRRTEWWAHVRRSRVTLAADHRASDGARGAAFLARIDQLLQDPGSL